MKNVRVLVQFSEMKMPRCRVVKDPCTDPTQRIWVEPGDATEKPYSGARQSIFLCTLSNAPFHTLLRSTLFFLCQFSHKKYTRLAFQFRILQPNQ